MAHSSIQELKRKIDISGITVGDLFYHYRDATKRYRVIAIALQEATEEPCIVYQNVENPSLIWVRNLDSWLAEVEYEGKKVARFVRI